MPRKADSIEGRKTNSDYVKKSRQKTYIEDYYSQTLDSIGGIEKIKNIFADVVLFSERLLGIKLYPYQEKILKDPSNKIVINAGRRVGKTTVASIMGLHFALTHDNVNVVIVSPTQRQSDILIGYIKRMISSSILVSMLVEKDISQEVWFKNGSKILSLPSGVDGRTIRGITSHMIIFDEAAFMPEMVFDVVMPSIIASKDYKIVLISTPNLEQGFFYNATKNWPSYYHIKTEECPSVNKDFLDEEKMRLDPYTYAREYEAQFVSAENSYFPLPMIARMFGNVNQTDNYPLYTVGVDIGRSGSKTCLILLGYEDGIYYGKQMIYGPSYSIVDFSNKIKEISNKYRPMYINIDSTGLGNALYEFLLNDGVPNIRQIVFTSAVKNKLLSNLRGLLETNSIKLPMDWKEIYEQMSEITISTDPLKSPRTKEQDTVIALGLAVMGDNSVRTVKRFIVR